MSWQGAEAGCTSSGIVGFRQLGVTPCAWGSGACGMLAGKRAGEKGKAEPGAAAGPRQRLQEQGRLHSRIGGGPELGLSKVHGWEGPRALGGGGAPKLC
jgi:hypothetical protein